MFITKTLCYILLTADWYDQKLEGWYYFQENSAAALAPDEADDILREEKQKVQEALSLAVLNPTKENIQNYTQLTDRLTHQSALFADKWGELIEEKDSHFLLFCFRGQDPSSEEAARAAQNYAKAHGLPLKALSLDGQGTDSLNDFETDLGIAAHLKVESTPALYVVNPFKNEATLLDKDHYE